MGAQIFPLFFVFLEDLVPRLLQLIVAVVQNFRELVGHLRVALAGEGVEDLRQLSLADDGVLDLTDCLIAENDVSLVNAELKGKEQDLDRSVLIPLLDLQLFLLDVERLWYVLVCLAATCGDLLLLLLTGTSLSATFAFFSTFASGLALATLDDAIALILHRNVKQDFLVEGVVDLKIDLQGLVKLS